MQSRLVLNAVLAVSAVQSWENGAFRMEESMLLFRSRAIRGSIELINGLMGGNDTREKSEGTQTANDSTTFIAEETDLMKSCNEDMTYLLATCVLLILYDKLSGETGDRSASHFQFLARVFQTRIFPTMANGDVPDNCRSDTMAFVFSLFIYNDLVRSTSFRIPTLSDFFRAGDSGRFAFAKIMARISAGDESVSDADISLWDGHLDLFPSVALGPSHKRHSSARLPISQPAFVYGENYRLLDALGDTESWSEDMIVSELYRVAAAIYRRQRVHRRSQHTNEPHKVTEDLECMDGGDDLMGNLPYWGAALIQRLSPTSTYNNVLLWPITIISKEMREQSARDSIIHRMLILEQRFRMKHFSVARDHLSMAWAMSDAGVKGLYEFPALLG